MCDKDDPPYTPKGCGRGRPKKEDDPVPEFSSPELSQGYRILQDIMGVSKFFLEQPNEKEKGMRDYYDIISKPMCFSEIKHKFIEGEYKKIPEFVCDVRLMLLNCYRYFGPDDVHTKRALRLEQIFEQKLALLPIELRNQCSLECTHADLEDDIDAGAFKHKGDVESRLLQSVIGERSRRERERKQRLQEERRAEKEGKEREILLWEKEKLFSCSTYESMENMWELPVICHFVTLSLEQLNINSISISEIERMFLMPEASKSLSVLMTTLLSTPLTRLKLHVKPPMPYKIWTAKLTHKVGIWYKLYLKLNKDSQTAFEKLGVEPYFWKIMGDWNPLEDYEFHELTFHQRVTLVKALCDYILQNHKFLRDMISEKIEDFGKCLGEDRFGAKFLYFPQFLDQDIRVYRQVLDPKCWLDREKDHQMELLAAKNKKSDDRSSLKKKLARRRRKSAWKRGRIIKQHKISSRKNLVVSKSTSRISGTCDKVLRSKSERTKLEKTEVSTDEKPTKSVAHGSGSEHTSPSDSPLEYCNIGERTVQNVAEDTPPILVHTNSETGEVETSAIPTDSSLQIKSESELTGCNSSQTKELVEEVGVKDSVNVSVVDVNEISSVNESQYSACTCSKENTPCKHLKPKQEDVQNDNKNSEVHSDQNPGLNVEPLVVVKDKNDFVVKEPGCTKMDAVPSFEFKCKEENTSSILDVKPVVKRPLHNPYWLEPDPEDFKLVANSVESVRQLLTKYCDNDLELIQMGNKKGGKGNRPSREVRLAHKLASLITDLEPLELKFVTNMKRAREKMYKEYQDFINRSPDFADPDEAFWLNEKEPVEPTECQTPDGQATINSDILEDSEDLHIPVADSGDILTGGMTLRHRRPEEHLFKDRLALGSSEESTEDDSDESDNWVMAKNRKRKRTPKLKNPNLIMSGKKKQSSQEKQNSSQYPEQQAKLTSDSAPEVEILDDVPKSKKKKRPQITAAAIRAKKRLFLQNEASSSEANRQLEWEKNRQKLVNSAAIKAMDPYPTKFIIDSANKIILDDNGTITVPSTNKNKALITLQGRKLGDIIKEGKLVKSRDIITDVIGIEIGGKQSQISGMQKKNIETIGGREQTNKKSSSSATLLEESNKVSGSKSKCTSSSSLSSSLVNVESTQKSQQNAVRGQGKMLKNAIEDFKASDTKQSKEHPVVLVPSVNDKGQTVYMKVTGPKAKQILERMKRSPKSSKSATSSKTPTIQPKVQTPTIQPSVVSSASCSVSSAPSTVQNSFISTIQTYSKSSTSAQTTSSVSIAGTVQSCHNAQHQQGQLTTQPVPNETNSELVYISDDSDNSEVEVVSVVYNSKSDHKLSQKTPCGKSSSAQLTGSTQNKSNVDDGSMHQIKVISNSVSNVHGGSPSTLHSQPKILFQNQINIGEQNKNVVPHFSGNPIMTTVNSSVIFQNQISMSSTNVTNHVAPNINIVLQNQNDINKNYSTPTKYPSPQITVQQFGSNNHLVSRNCQPQTKPNSNVSMAQVANSSTPLLQVKSPDVLLANVKNHGASFMQERNFAAFSTQIRNPGPSLTQFRGPISNVVQVKNPGLPQMRMHNAPLFQVQSSVPSVRSPYTLPSQTGSPGTPLVHVRSPGMASTQTRYPGLPLTQMRSPGTLSTQMRGPGPLLAPVRSPGATAAQVRNSNAGFVRMGSPGSSVMQVRSPGVPLAQVRSVSAPSMTKNSSTNLLQIRAPGGTFLPQIRNPGSSGQMNATIPFAQTGIPSARSTNARQINNTVTQVHGRGIGEGVSNINSRSIEQRPNQPTARLVVIPGDEKTGSNYALVFPNGNRVILTPKQVADIRAANGGVLTTSVEI